MGYIMYCRYHTVNFKMKHPWPSIPSILKINHILHHTVSITIHYQLLTIHFIINYFILTNLHFIFNTNYISLINYYVDLDW